MGTTTDTPTPNTLAALAITDGREPHALDLGVREAAADCPVGPVAADRSGRLTYPSPHPY